MKRYILFSFAIIGLCVFGYVDVQAGHTDHGCHGCHVPHKAAADSDADGIWGVPLWSPAENEDGLPVFTLYSSDTLDATVDQPDGPSKMCLGCHDGSYFVFGFLGNARVFSDDPNSGDMDLAHSHPVSFVYDSALATADGELHDPLTKDSDTGNSLTIDAELLDVKDKMQCTSCHDIHVGGLTEYLLRWDIENAGDLGDGLMCRVCHIK